MILSAAQPYFAPYPGFFEKMLRSDLFVILDTVQFPRGGTWMTRNRFKNDRGELWIRLPVHKKGLGLQQIDRVKIVRQDQRWVDKHVSSLQHAYRNAPFFRDHFGVLRNLFESGLESLAELNISLIAYVAGQCGIACRTVRLSATGIEARGTELLAALCRRYGADTLLAQSPAQKYLDPEPFAKAGIRLVFLQPKRCIYPQLWGDFVANLSVFDLLFCCGPRAGAVLGQDL